MTARKLPEAGLLFVQALGAVDFALEDALRRERWYLARHREVPTDLLGMIAMFLRIRRNADALAAKNVRGLRGKRRGG